MGRPNRVVVVGAGAFGAWIAWGLRRAGVEVVLVDAFGPGNARASSGGETRVIRAVYGDMPIYGELTHRALGLWRQWDREHGTRLCVETGALWLSRRGDPWMTAGRRNAKAAGTTLESVGLREAARRWPQIAWPDVDVVEFEPQAGYLFARQACRAVVDDFIRLGGIYKTRLVQPIVAAGPRLGALACHDAGPLEADAFVLAPGPWASLLLGDRIGFEIKPTRQEVHFFGTPAGDTLHGDDALPVWLDRTAADMVYGIPGNAGRGFKIADDRIGRRFNPTTSDRTPSPAAVRRDRQVLARRFPALADAPLLETRVCQYEMTPDRHLIVDRHPHHADCWIVAGGSGHGFKLGPALGERVVEAVLDARGLPPEWAVRRFAGPAHR